MDAVAVDAVVEARAECADLERARAALGEALREARGPRRGRSDDAKWNVTVRVLQPSSGERRAEGVILDDRGTLVAQRTISDRGGRTCVPFARAVGTWASLVLDDEMTRAREVPEVGTSASTSAASEALAAASHPASAPVESDPDHVATPSSTTRTVEVGAMMMLRGGDGTGSFAAFSPYVAFEVARSWLLRPALALGRTPANGGDIVGGARLDFCRRVPGNYIDRRGIELDVCAGADAFLVMETVASTVGPAVNLRGELGGGLAIELRGVAGAVLAQGPIASPDGPPIMAAAELGVSVRLP